MSINGAAPVHPTFFYESLWCILGFVLLYIFARKWQKHYGEVFFGYLAWYGAERAIVEGLRTDSLYIGSTSIRVSQVLAAVLFIVGVVLFILARKGVFEKIGSAKKTEKTAELVTVTGEEPVSDEETVIEEITEIETVEEPETEEQNREVKTEGNTEDHGENN